MFPTFRNAGSVNLQVLKVQLPETPWHLHFILISPLTA